MVFVRKNKYYEVELDEDGIPLGTPELEAQIAQVIMPADESAAIPYSRC